MSKLTLKMQERGPFLKVTLLVIRADNNFSEMNTKPININNMAIVEIKLKAVTSPKYNLGLIVQFKKTDNPKNSIVSLNITSDGYDKQFFCNSEAVEVVLPSKGYDCCLTETVPCTMLYNIEMKMTVQDIEPVPPVITYNELHKEAFDLSLQAEDGTLPIHKAALFVQSEMFRNMLRGKWRETEEDSMTMPGTVQTLRHLKEYIYFGILPEGEIIPLLLLAKYCLMDELANKCIERLIKSAKPETFDDLVNLACGHNIPELVKGLFLGIPDDVVNGILQLNINANT